MTLGFLFILIVAWVFWKAIQFYRRMDWDEPAEPSPDFHAMTKQEAQLLHIQDVLEEAHQKGKVSAQFMEEYQRFCEKEIEEMNAAKQAWKNRPKN